jgi:hypothetical protein
VINERHIVGHLLAVDDPSDQNPMIARFDFVGQPTLEIGGDVVGEDGLITT